MRWNENCTLISLSEEPTLDELLQPTYKEVGVEVSCNSGLSHGQSIILHHKPT